MTIVVGISAYFHDSAAALLLNGKIIAAAQEERFTRHKHDASFPRHALEYVLSEGGVSLSDVDYFAFHDKPFLKFERLIETYLSFTPKGFSSFRRSLPIWLNEKLFMKSMLQDELIDMGATKGAEKKLLFAEHHLSHAASAFYPSPFEEALILTMDGVGEWATSSLSIGRGNHIEILREMHFPHSLGLLYSAFTYYLGFRVNSGEYKVMGLAPYGEPRFVDLILDRLIDLKADGSFRLDQSYFDYATGMTMTGKRFADLFGQPRREPDGDNLKSFHMDVARSLQAVTERIMLQITRALADEFDVPNLCLAGGVALNCVANGKILRDGQFDGLWIQPASGDAGGALGSALSAWHGELGKPRQIEQPDAMQGSLLGPSYDQPSIEEALTRCGAIYTRHSDVELIEVAATALAEGSALGWFQGRMEFGPRALGARSILADPRSESMQKTLNLKVKYRESFRPFAPAVLRDHVSDWFDLDHDSPYMLLVADIQKSKCRDMSRQEKALFGIDKLNVSRSQVPAITHVDYSARIQTVDGNDNPRFYSLLEAFNALTGCPLLVNTSFNVRGEPIVNTPEDAFRCFMGTDLDLLVIGNSVLRKSEQTAESENEYRFLHDAD